MKNKKPIFIAEVKTQSPYGFAAKDSWFELLQIADKVGDWISIHTNPLWGGSFEAISLAKKITNKPILAKGLHTTDDDVKRALDHGADYVLVVDRVPSSFNLDTSKVIMELPAKIIIGLLNGNADYRKNFKYCYNLRSLKTGLLHKASQLDEVTKVVKEAGGWICQASGIHHRNMIHSDVNAFIVGEHLREFYKPKRYY